MGEKTILVWFRNDLRIHDNEILLEAIKKADKVLPVYCFDPYYFKQDSFGNPKTGLIRTKFLLEAVANLRKNLRRKGGDLVVRIGSPAKIIPELAVEFAVNEVYHHREVAQEETQISEEVETALWKLKLNLKHFIGHTLYHKEDLPFPIKDIPESFVVFKKKIERESVVRPCLETPYKILVPEIEISGEIPDLTDLGFRKVAGLNEEASIFTGGEDAALKQLRHFLVQSDQPEFCKNGKNLTPNLSRLSPWLALGCISLRHVYWEVINNQNSNPSNILNRLILDLLWRDYFRFMFKKHGKKFIMPDKERPEEIIDLTLTKDSSFEKWKNGKTGVRQIDDIMIELKTTGFINNQNRQIVAGYLINDLKVDWKKGAAYFEETLVDYSPASNWGNWAFIAGVNDALVSKYHVAVLPVTTA